MVVVALNAPATGATAIAHPSRAFARAIPHTIKPFRSIGGVRLGFTVAQVDRRFGRPDHRFPVPHHHLAKYIYDDENFEVGFGGVLLRVIWVASYRRQGPPKASASIPARSRKPAVCIGTACIVRTERAPCMTTATGRSPT
jgi:hypothetical protein